MKIQSVKQRLLHSTMIGGAALMTLTAASAVSLLTPTAAVAQSQTGALRIDVRGDDGQPLSGATVTVSSPDSLVTRTGVTDVEGRVRLAGLDPATNYTVRVAAPGYDEYVADNVAVVSGRDLSQGYVLVSGARAAEATNLGDVIVTGRSLAAVDVTSATVGTTLNLAIVEALPTGRDYQSYLQLVPGVKPGRNPSSRSGINYRDAGGAIGSSTDNLYFLDGIDVTDPSSGTFGANFNSEIIQEQQVIVGGVPAEYAGGSGLISSVVTKSGGNEWHGSINYYFQNDQLVAEDEHGTSAGFSTYDTAFTLGGPIIRDRLWIFGSYQKKNREDEVVDPNTNTVLRSVTRDDEYAFLKATWQITDDDRLTGTYFSDPVEISGSSDETILNNRDRTQAQGGDNYKVDYTRTWNDLTFNAYYFNHEAELSQVSADKSIRDTVSFYGLTPSTNVDRQLGGAGSDIETFRNREEFGFNLEYYLDTSFGTHTFKAGYSSSENIYEEDSTVPGGETYTSLSIQDTGWTFEDIANGVDTDNDGDADTFFSGVPFTNDDRARMIAAIDASPNRAAIVAALDTDTDGNVDADEISAAVFDDTAGNPYGNVNLARSVRAVDAPYSVKSEGKALYVQDTWTMDQLTINAGLRAEEWTHFASDGSELFTFEWEIAPRLSVVYDLFGDGRTKVFAFGGRYYDPIRNNMTDFAGALTGPVTNEQVYLGGEWLTFRVRGGAVIPDSVFAPTLKTPYTDEFMIGASTTFRDDITLSVTATNRKTRDIFEDYDLAVYSNPNPGTNNAGNYEVAHPGSSLYLPYEYFGFDGAPNANYVLGTLAGGKRNYTGFEVTLQKFKTDNWQGMVSYTYNQAEGNTNSDGNADLQGDLINLDPRAPGMWGDQPGNIEHQFKAFASYEFDFGLDVAGVFNWNSGALYTPGVNTYGRIMPQGEDPYVYEGVEAAWLQPGLIGSETGPSYYTFDMRFKYVMDLPLGGVELFLDVFNVLNNQAAISEQALIAGDGVYAFQDATDWVEPRRAYLGVRYSF